MNQITDNITRNEFSHITQNSDGKIFIQFDDYSLVDSRPSFGHNRLLPTIHHISPIELLYGPARSRPASLHALEIESVDKIRDSAKYVSKFKVNPKTNIVQDADSISTKIV
ncbi:MAG: hypothetical protein Q8830_03560 [Candidatus Phytoplasma australasiaticum]|nr:hypothetical protein [Candidatus Phytoplasma australasiaticum]